MMVRLLRVVRWVEERVPSALLAVITLVVTADVVGRYVFHHPLQWAGELATLLFVWTVFLSVSAGLNRGLHVNMDLLVAGLSQRARAGIALGIYTCALVSFVIIGGLGLQYATESHNIQLHTLGLPFTWAVVAVPVSSLLLCFHLVRFIFYSAKGLKTGVFNLPQAGFEGTGCLLTEQGEDL